MDAREMMRRRMNAMYGGSGSEDISKVRFEKLGDALHYVITFELAELAKASGQGEAPHFYAVLSYMQLNKLIDELVATKVHMAMFLESSGEESIKSVIEKVSKLLIGSLKDNIKFRDFGDLVDKLNEYVIERWYFDIGQNLIESYATDSFLHNKMLYFIGKNKNKNDHSLNRISVERISSDTDLSDDRNVEMLADGFSNVLAMDEHMQRIYLQMYDQENCFAYYDILNNEIVMCKGRFLELVNKFLWIITEDGWVAYVAGDKVHRVRQYVDGEDYERKKGYFLVTPDKESERFFYPYYVFPDGNTKLADKKDYGVCLWERFTKGIFENDYSEFRFRLFETPAWKMAKMPSKFSINNIMESINEVLSEDKRCNNRGYILLESFFDMMKKYVDPIKDYTKLWFTLAEAGSYLGEGSVFPSEELYWRIKEMEVENDSEDNAFPVLLQNYNYDRLFAELVKEVKYGKLLDLDECVAGTKEEELMILNADHSVNDNVKIGTFDFINGMLIAEVMSLEEGMFIGDQIIPMIDLSLVGGLVVYDAFHKRSIVISDVEIDRDNKLKIEKSFCLKDSSVMYVRREFTVEEKKKREALTFARKMETEFTEDGYEFYESDFYDEVELGDYMPTEEEWKMLQDMATTLFDEED